MLTFTAVTTPPMGVVSSTMLRAATIVRFGDVIGGLGPVECLERHGAFGVQRLHPLEGLLGIPEARLGLIELGRRAGFVEA